MAYKNPDDQRAAWRRWYERNKQNVVERVAERKKGIRTLISSAKEKPCADCGVQYPPHVMDFDHVRGEKAFQLGNSEAKDVSKSVLQAEIAKCDVVCANCHRTRTFERRTIGL